MNRIVVRFLTYLYEAFVLSTSKIALEKVINEFMNSIDSCMYLYSLISYFRKTIHTKSFNYKTEGFFRTT